MSNSITIHIGDRDPHAYWNQLHDQVRVLYNAAADNGWLGTTGHRDIETVSFMLDFFSRMNTQRPPKIPKKKTE